MGQKIYNNLHVITKSFRAEFGCNRCNDEYSNLIIESNIKKLSSGNNSQKKDEFLCDDNANNVTRGVKKYQNCVSSFMNYALTRITNKLIRKVVITKILSFF